MALTFNGHYAEHFRLTSGERLRLRLVRPSDKEHLQRGFSVLSPASRLKRFLASKTTISDAELRYFTELDQFDHFAIGVMELDAAGEEVEGAGIGRFIRFANDPRRAEVAITVIDRMQGKGIGRRLLESLIAAALERDVERFRFECLPHNLEMQRLVRSVCPGAPLVRDDAMIVSDANLPDPSPGSDNRSGAEAPGMYGVLSTCALETLEWQIGIGLDAFRRAFDFVFNATSIWQPKPGADNLA